MTAGTVPGSRRIVAVLPDVTGVDRSFAYAVPAALAGAVEIGSIVRVPLHGRRVRGWVIGGADEPDGYELREILGVVSLGPSPELVELGRFGAWRYAGRLRPFLLAGSPPRIVRALPVARPAFVARAKDLGLTYAPDKFPVVFWDIYGEQGHPVRATVAELGPLLLSRMLDLNDTQEGVLNIVFRVADEQGLLLLDLKDLRAALGFVAEDRKSVV